MDVKKLEKDVHIDVTDLEYLYYRCPNKENVKIYTPQSLMVTDEGHYVVDSYNNEHFIPKEKFFHLKAKYKTDTRPVDVITES
jgi:hypothetical protein